MEQWDRMDRIYRIESDGSSLVHAASGRIYGVASRA